jgi:hypothetical protein
VPWVLDDYHYDYAFVRRLSSSRPNVPRADAMSERIANIEFVNWFDQWRAELKSRALGEPTLREEGQGQVSPGHTNVRSSSETIVIPTKAV